MSIETTIIGLRNLLKAHNIRYYTLSNPSISDSEYDELKRRLLSLELRYPEFDDTNSPTKTVGSPVLTKGFNKIVRTTPMLSIQDVFDIEGVDKLINLSSSDCIAEYKIDGLGLELVYVNGALVSASTRGDGLIGEDVTNNAYAISEIPIKLPINFPRIEIRGEVYMRYDVFEDINSKLIAAGEKTYANTRNLASGSLKQLDPKTTAERNLSFFAYALGASEGYSFISQDKFLEDLKSWGFPISEYSVFPKNVNIINAYIAKVACIRSAIAYAIDGIVIKVNDFKEQERIGYRSNSPKWAVAYKFPAEEVRTRIFDCVWQVGRTGTITPVAKVMAVEVGGTIVSSITLHNRLEIKRKDLRLNDYVYIRRAGDVIPEIVRVDVAARETSSCDWDIELPTKCPECNSSLHYDETFIRCINHECPARILRKFTHYVSRDAANIDGLSAQTIEQLIDAGLVSEFIDLYRLEKSELLKLDRFGERKADKLLESVRISQEKMTLPRLLYALGINNVGSTTARDLANTFGSFQRIYDAAMNLDELLEVENIGGIIADSISSYLIHNKENIDILIDECFPQAGVFTKIQTSITQNLVGKSFLFTGTFEKLVRKQAEDFVVAKGGHTPSSVSKTLDYLVVGAKAGSKLTKATVLGITLLNEQEFIELVKYI
jgi:DNA ligase (NAD+)